VQAHHGRDHEPVLGLTSRGDPWSKRRAPYIATALSAVFCFPTATRGSCSRPRPELTLSSTTCPMANISPVACRRPMRPRVARPAADEAVRISRHWVRPGFNTRGWAGGRALPRFPVCIGIHTNGRPEPDARKSESEFQVRAGLPLIGAAFYVGGFKGDPFVRSRWSVVRRYTRPCSCIGQRLICACPRSQLAVVNSLRSADRYMLRDSLQLHLNRRRDPSSALVLVTGSSFSWKGGVASWGARRHLHSPRAYTADHKWYVWC